MKQIEGIPNNINETIIGIVVKNKYAYLTKKNCILVTDKPIKSNRYSAVITNQTIDSSITSVVVSNINDFNIDDIVTIDSKGQINIVHEANSKHNALFVTGKCNSNCIMCPQPPIKKEADRHNINLKHISLLPKDTISLGITGGEPTLAGKKLFEIIELVNKKLPHTWHRP